MEKVALTTLDRMRSKGRSVKQLEGMYARLSYELDVLEDKKREIKEIIDRYLARIETCEQESATPTASFESLISQIWSNIIKGFQALKVSATNGSLRNIPTESSNYASAASLYHSDSQVDNDSAFER